MGTPSDPGTGKLLQAMDIDDLAALEDVELLARVASPVSSDGRRWPCAGWIRRTEESQDGQIAPV